VLRAVRGLTAVSSGLAVMGQAGVVVLELLLAQRRYELCIFVAAYHGWIEQEQTNSICEFYLIQILRKYVIQSSIRLESFLE